MISFCMGTEGCIGEGTPKGRDRLSQFWRERLSQFSSSGDVEMPCVAASRRVEEGRYGG